MKKPVRKFKETIEIRTSVWNRIRSHRHSPLALFAVAFLLACSFHIWQRVKVLALVSEVAELRQENRSLIDASTKLNTEIAALSMSSRVECYAADSLGMKPVEADRIYTMLRERDMTERPDEFGMMLEAFERVTRHLPVIAPSQATARELKRIKFEDDDEQGEGSR